MDRWVNNLITVSTDPVTRVWTGYGDLTVGTRTFLGMGRALSVGAMELSAEEPDKRLVIELSGIPQDQRAVFLQDVGPVEVLIEWVWSNDAGETWTKLTDIQFRGRLSSPSFSDGVFRIEVETYRGDVDAGQPKLWSNEDQQRRTPGDLGMEYMRILANEGLETGWPP